VMDEIGIAIFLFFMVKSNIMAHSPMCDTHKTG
jgi:hypothetical protein